VTCEEFRAIAMTPPESQTRATRAIHARHVDGCRECLVWLAGPLAPLLSLGKEAVVIVANSIANEIDHELVAKINAMQAGDHADPEYWDARAGK
jgi:hypothetical protein